MFVGRFEVSGSAIAEHIRRLMKYLAIDVCENPYD